MKGDKGMGEVTHMHPTCDLRTDHGFVRRVQRHSGGL